ncbi:hypothetical protein [Georgenia sp. Z1491]|uniref:hypothetical protein n=1 Tax=Georgenia sp. Z1491 TaxID=3416707 RepID=UPI003CF7D958
MTDLNAGIVLLTVVAIAFGGAFLLRVVGGQVPANELQRTYFRAGHAHAGVLVILGLVIGLYLRGADVPAWAETMSVGVLLGAILMPLGFFLSVVGRDPQRPNAMRWCIAAGGISVVVGVIGAGAGLVVVG